MAVINGTVHNVSITDGGTIGGSKEAEVMFTMSGTYAQADNGALLAVASLIQNNQRNGKAVTLVDVMKGAPATKASDPAATMSLSTVAISTADVTFALTDGDESTELANGAIPAQDRPFCITVRFTEA